MNLDWQQLYATFLPFIPAEIAGDLTLVGTFIIALCALVARFWPKPATGSKWFALYSLINKIGMNSKHAANADDAEEPRR
ncbi:hypothetical protein C0V97_01645 [Asaia sp. W19]|uniref:hypothetical protein n=1 Tax=unclassified Asaia TaxID=2685023 RepID=UPI000F8F2A48|nr:hypothetical protein [Asaia sp. W19]RUT27339.1 hypothetical protein C0V97_01645 [Asaia sp. W19]